MQADSSRSPAVPPRTASPAPAATPAATATPARAVAFHAAFAYLTAGALWDLAGSLQLLPPWWPAAGYLLLALGAGVFCLALLARLLQTPRGAPRRSGLTAAELAAVGLLLGALVLRGDAEIPPDPPLVTAEILSCLALLAIAVRRRR